MLLAARALGYEGDRHITLATLIEFMHTSTLLHDDVVDESHMRRGKPTANDAVDSHVRKQLAAIVEDIKRTMQLLCCCTDIVAVTTRPLAPAQA